MSELIGYRQTVLISCRGKAKILGKEELKDNIMTIDWHMQTSFAPFLYAISIGKKRFSHDIIDKSKVFCVNFMPFSLKDKILFCGRNTGMTMDKFKETGLTKEECDKIDCCRINEAIGYLECQIIEQVKTGDHTIFIGKVLLEKLKSNENRAYHQEGNEFRTI